MAKKPGLSRKQEKAKAEAKLKIKRRKESARWEAERAERITEERQMTAEKNQKEEMKFYEDKNFKVATALNLKFDRNDPDEWWECLEFIVQRHMELGWRPHGTIFTSTRSVKVNQFGERFDAVKQYCQTLVKN